MAYHLNFCGSPYCDRLGSVAGLDMVDASGVQSCSYRTRREALSAKRKLETFREGAYAGSVRIVEGDCPRWLDFEKARGAS